MIQMNRYIIKWMFDSDSFDTVIYILFLVVRYRGESFKRISDIFQIQAVSRQEYGCALRCFPKPARI